jgi:hypothetical protein
VIIDFEDFPVNLFLVPNGLVLDLVPADLAEQLGGLGYLIF